MEVCSCASPCGRVCCDSKLEDEYSASNFHPIVSGFTAIGRFFSFVTLYTVGRTSWTGDQPVARSVPTHRPHTIIHDSSGIRNHDPSVQAAEDNSWLRPLDHRTCIFISWKWRLRVPPKHRNPLNQTTRCPI
jgi:hypothetical protein